MKSISSFEAKLKGEVEIEAVLWITMISQCSAFMIRARIRVCTFVSKISFLLFNEEWRKKRKLAKGYFH